MHGSSRIVAAACINAPERRESLHPIGRLRDDASPWTGGVGRLFRCHVDGHRPGIVKGFTDSIFSATAALLLRPMRQLLSNTSQLLFGRRARMRSFLAGRHGPIFRNQQQRLPCGQVEYIADAVMRHVDPVEAVRQFLGQPNLHRLRLRPPTRDVAPASIRSRGQTGRWPPPAGHGVAVRIEVGLSFSAHAAFYSNERVLFVLASISPNPAGRRGLNMDEPAEAADSCAAPSPHGSAVAGSAAQAV